ncbi:MAG: hypothetical protein WB766_23140 [Roseiarcus sp.]
MAWRFALWRGEAAGVCPGGAESSLAEAAIVQEIGCGPVIAAGKR